DFTAPVRKDGLEHIDYVPTQVVSEHFRFIHKTKEGKKVDGIIYPSSKFNKRNAIVLFCDDKDCVERDAKGGLLRLISLKRINPNKYI
ncbi:TPA: RES family NAD+ phosphorylase, partial [Vibrio cholerae]|nr:RES family NAD+ phosphorylase [Vibrio cholerae]